MADDEVTPLTTTTTNYGWVKPDVGASDDVWGGMLNADLDGIDSIVHGIDIRPSGGATISATPPASPAAGALWWDTNGGQLYTFYNDGNSSQWVVAVNAGASLLPASTTVLGGVKVDGATIQAAADGTISTIGVPINENRLINGDMRIDQRGVASGAGGTASVYAIDRWVYFGSQATKFTWTRQGPFSPATASGFPYHLRATSASAYASLAADLFYFQQRIEADATSDFQFGTATAQPVTLSFWANSSLAGTFSGALSNDTGSRTYPFSYALTANTWTRIVVTIPGDTTGTWVTSGNACGLIVLFDLGCGSTYRGSAGAWSGNNYVGVTGAVSVVGTNAATFNVTGVKLEIGSVATPFNRQSLAKSLADCQRYFQVIQMLAGGYTTAGISCYGSAQGTTMRATPTITQISQAGANLGTLTYGAQTASTFFVSGSAVATTSWVMNATASASAEL